MIGIVIGLIVGAVIGVIAGTWFAQETHITFYDPPFDEGKTIILTPPKPKPKPVPHIKRYYDLAHEDYRWTCEGRSYWGVGASAVAAYAHWRSKLPSWYFGFGSTL